MSEENCTTIYALVGIFIGIPVAVFVYFVLRSLTVVQQKEVMVVERFGKFHRLLNPGLHFLLPFDAPKTIIWRTLETSTSGSKVLPASFTRIDSRQCLFDFPLQPIITRDNVEIEVHPMLVYEFVDAIRIAYETFDLRHAVEKLVQTTLRSIIGDMGLDDTLASREEINRGILLKISQVCLNWGIKIHRVELLEIVPNNSVQNAMHRQLAAERLRRASIVTAEGFREKVKTEAEGQCQSKIALATGQQQVSIIQAKAKAEAKLLIAKAEADALETVKGALANMNIDASQYMVALRYMETISDVATCAQSCVLYMPYETDVSGATVLMT